MYKYLFIFLFSFILLGCSLKQPKISNSATVIFKTPNMKFYDKGFITTYDDYIHLQVFSAGTIVLNLEIYENRICQSTLKCLSGEDFNKQYLSKDYEDNFLYNLFSRNNIKFKDKKNNILIKVIND